MTGREQADDRAVICLECGEEFPDDAEIASEFCPSCEGGL